MVCASCGTESPEGFRFCGGCGADRVDEATELLGQGIELCEGKGDVLRATELRGQLASLTSPA